METVSIYNRVQVDFQFNNGGYFAPTIYHIVLDSLPKIGDRFYFDSSLKNYEISDLVEWKSLLNEDARKEYDSLDAKLQEITKKGKQSEESEKDTLRAEYQSILNEMVELIDDCIPIWDYNKVIAIYRSIGNKHKGFDNDCRITIVLGKDEDYAEQIFR